MDNKAQSISVIPDHVQSAISNIWCHWVDLASIRNDLYDALFNHASDPNSLFQGLIKTINMIESKHLPTPISILTWQMLLVELRICHKYGWLNDPNINYAYDQMESRLSAMDKNPVDVITQVMQEFGFHDLAKRYLEDRDKCITKMNKEVSIMQMTNLERIEELIKLCERRANECATKGMYFFLHV